MNSVVGNALTVVMGSSNYISANTTLYGTISSKFPNASTIGVDSEP